MKSRVIVYSILIGALVLLVLFGWKIGARRLIFLVAVGIVFLLIHLVRGNREEAG
jgi:protein-S-isoprenylcysteine O-methyltransferase Ste14